MSAEREELARAIFIADNANAPDAAREWDWAGYEKVDYAYAIADGLIAAGYRKPWQVTTVKDLDALPAKTVVLESDGYVAVRDHEGGWFGADDDGSTTYYKSRMIALPATVIHEPEAP